MSSWDTKLTKSPLVGIVKAGTLHLESDPFVFVVQNEWVTELCGNCLDASSASQLRACPKCQFYCYCTKNCSRLGRSDHEEECFLISRKRVEPPPSWVRLLARLIKKVQTGSTLPKEWPDIKFAQFPEHISQVAACLQIYCKLYRGIDFSDTPDREQLMQLGLKLRVNTTAIILDEKQLVAGLGFYPTICSIKHSCDPTAVLYHDEKVAKIRIIKDVQSVKEELTIAYTHGIRTTKERQSRLFIDYEIQCKCGWCKDDRREKRMQSFTCITHGCSNVLMSFESNCPRCNQSASKLAQMVDTETRFCGMLKHPVRPKTTNVNLALNFFQITHLSESHITRMQLARRVMQSVDRTLMSTHDVVMVGKEMCVGQDKYCPLVEFCPRIMFHVGVGLCSHEKNSPESCRAGVALMGRALELQRIMFGAQSCERMKKQKGAFDMVLVALNKHDPPSAGGK